jgi:hypothetical protein
MATQMYDIEWARRVLADAGYIARVSAVGHVLCVYDGDVDDPGTWMECERIAIRDGKVDGAALALLCGNQQHTGAGDDGVR